MVVSRSRSEFLPFGDITVSGVVVETVDYVLTLSVTFDPKLLFERHQKSGAEYKWRANIQSSLTHKLVVKTGRVA